MQATLPTKTSTLGQRPAPKTVLAALCLACGILTTAAPAATDKSGIIEGETWTKEMSPIRVVGDITVYSLTIKPGVEVLFTGNFKFDCEGVLQAKGKDPDKEPDKIVFHGDTGITWQGIDFFPGSSDSVMDYCIVQNSAANGIAITNCFPAISNCEIKNNSGSWGGGMDIRLNVPGTLVFSECTISNNTAWGGYGGGVLVSASANAVVRFVDCDVIDNSVQRTNSAASGGGAYFEGAGKCELLRCPFRGNQVTVSDSTTNGFGYNSVGGGVCASISTLSMRNCKLSSNTAQITGSSPSGSISMGGGLYFSGSILSLYNILMLQNSVAGGTERGGGLYLGAGTARVENCTVANNIYEELYRAAGTLTVINSIIYDTGGTPVAGTATITYSDVLNGYTGTGNIYASPLFRADGTVPSPWPWSPPVPSSWPWPSRLSGSSPCKDAGNPDPSYNDRCFYDATTTPWGSLGTARNDMGAYGGPGACLWEPGSGPPKFVSLPGCGLVGVGDTVTLRVIVSGIPPFTYVWKKNGEAIIDNPPHITGQGTDTLTITNATSADEGNYTVDVTNFMATITSSSSGGAMVSIDPLRVNVKMFAGLIIQAEEGKTVEVQYSNDLCSGTWTTLTKFPMPKPPYTYYDTDSPNHPQRFYRAAVVP